MFRANTTTSTSATDKSDTIIGKPIVIDGNLKGSGTIRVDGTINGDVDVFGDVIISKDAVINGNIMADNVTCHGKIQGNLVLKNQVYLTETSELVGDITVKSIVVDEGGTFLGSCKMVAADKPLEIKA